ncbi:hypothetical protein ACS0TY_022970 [Phlomoides rotata]
MTNLTFITLISTSFLFCLAVSQSTVKTLPGYSGNLPFKLETGYISVGESEEIELFYYFLESERNPKEDPLLLWQSGGPGCSSLSGIAFGIGPFTFDVASFNGSLTPLIPWQHSWTKIANVIFIDSPVGTGFSYTTQAKSFHSSDTLTAKHVDTFLRKWLMNHPEFIRNDLYIAGDSYGGKIVPIIVSEILKSNEAGAEPQMSLQGYLIGNPTTDYLKEMNERIPYAHRMGLISSEYYESAKNSCFGEYVRPDPDNVECFRALERIYPCLNDISDEHVLDTCWSIENFRGALLEDDEDQFDFFNILPSSKTICTGGVKNIMANVWANNPRVQDALHVRKGTIKEWKRCTDKVLPGYEMIASSVPYHQVLTQKISKAMVYSGDHDITIPYTATLKWIQQLNLTVDESWRPWIVKGQIAGYTQRYKENGFSLTYATVLGAGHIAPHSNPEQSFAMVDRWLSSNPL